MADDRYYVYALNPHPTTATVWVGTWHPDTVGDSELWLITSAGSKRIAAYDAPDVEDDFSTIGAAAPTIPVLAEAPLGACHFTTKRITRLSPHTAYRVEWRRSDGTVLASARFVTLPRGLATADMPALTEPAVIAPGGSSPPGQAAIGGLASGPGRMGVAPGGAFSGGGAAPEVAGERRGEAIPVRPETEHTLTVLTGSCFWYRGATNELERLAAYLAAQGLLPDMTFLTGDQVYVDQTPADDWIIPKSDDALERFVTRRYWSTWRRLIDVLAMGSNIMITDDHEFWNDYPYEPLGLVWPALQSETYRNKVEDVTQRFVAAVQQSPVVQQIDVGSDLSFFVADTRRKGPSQTRRSATQSRACNCCPEQTSTNSSAGSNDSYAPGCLSPVNRCWPKRPRVS
jgi:hypothetical protein